MKILSEFAENKTKKNYPECNHGIGKSKVT